MVAGAMSRPTVRFALLGLSILAAVVAVERASAWWQVEHDASMTPLASPLYEGRDNAASPSANMSNLYAATNLLTGWTPMAGCDDCVATFSTPATFTFPFYGTLYSTFTVSSNGFIGFSPTMPNGCCTGQSIPTLGAPDGFMAPYWNDLYPFSGPYNWDWLVTNPFSNTSREVLVIRWHQVPRCCSSTPAVSVQAHLYELTGVIEFHYNPSFATGTTAIGIEAPSGTTGVRYMQGNANIPGGRVVQFRPFQMAPIARDDLYTGLVSGTDIVNFFPPTHANLSANDIAVGAAWPGINPATVTAPVAVLTGLPWGSITAAYANGTFSMQMSPTCPVPAGSTFDVRFRYQGADGNPTWRTGTSANVILRVLCSPNLPPVANDDTFSTDEGPGPWQFNVTANDSDPDAGDIFWVESIQSFSGPGTLVVTGGSTRLQYTPPNEDHNSAIGGPLTARYRLRDRAGLTDTANVTITINPINDAPLFTPGPALVTVQEGAGAVSVPWASGRAAGPPAATDEATQVLTWSVTDDNPALFTAGGRPALSPTGQLTFTLADADVNRLATGDANVQVRLRDNGPSTSPHANTSTVASFVITVDPVNDAPSFTPGPALVTVLEGPATHSVAWATGTTAGPTSDEASQTLTFELLSNDNPALFAAGGQPTIDAAGVLAFTPLSPDVNRLTHGDANVTFRIRDNGLGTAPHNNVGNTGSVQIHIRPVNDPPWVQAGHAITVPEGPVLDHSFTGWLAGFGPGGGADEAAQGVSIDLVTQILTGPPDLFSAGPTLVGGTLSFQVRDADAFGTAQVRLTATDTGGNVLPDRNVGDPALALITVSPVNDPPVAIDDLLPDVLPTRPTQALASVLANDLDVDNLNSELRTLQVNPGAAGAAYVDSDGRTIRYSPPLDFRGPIVMQYRASDGLLASNWANATFVVRAPTTPVVDAVALGRACQRQPVAFQGYAVLRDHVTDAWIWSVDGQTVTVPGGSDLGTVSFTFPSPGLRTIQLTVRFTDGAASLPTATFSFTVLVEGCVDPVAAFQHLAAGPTVNFFDESVDADGTIVAWSWDFGDGTTSSQRHPTHAYPAAGAYTVRLTVRDNEGNTGTLGRVLNLERTLGGAPAYGGGSGGGTPATVPTPPPPPVIELPPASQAAAGTRPPVARASGPAAAVPGEFVAMSSRGTHDPDGDPLRLTWSQVSGPDVVVVQDADGNAGFQAAGPGTIVIELVADDGSSQDRAQVAVLVENAPGPVVAAFTPVVDAVSPLRVSFADRSVASRDASYSWDFGDGSTSTDRVPVHQYAREGHYVVRLVVVDGAKEAEAIHAVRVGAPAEPEPADLGGQDAMQPAGRGDGINAPLVATIVAGAVFVAAVAVALVALLRRR